MIVGEEGGAIDAEQATQQAADAAEPEAPVELEVSSDAAPEAPPGSPPVAEPSAPCRARSYVPGWPFVLYLMVWAGLAAITIVSLRNPGSPAVPLEDEAYPVLLAAGVVLVGCGPVLSVLVWLAARAKAPSDCRSGLFATSLVLGAGATLFGVVAWWGALLLVDALRLGIVQ